METKKMKEKMTRNKNTVIVAASIALMVLACAFAVYLRLYTGKELWYEMFAAVIGVVITAVITMMLLVGQTENDEKRERNSKVFEEKLRIYKEYLETLCNVIKNGNTSPTARIELAFKTTSVAMHCEHEHVKDISERVKNIYKTIFIAGEGGKKGKGIDGIGKDEWNKILLNSATLL